jgi:hypothetical protein
LVTPLTTAFKEELPKLMASDMPKEMMADQKSDKAGDKMIHPQIRKAVLDKLKSINSGKIFWYDGRPAFLAPEELPAVAVYLTDAKATGGSIDEEEWEAVLHIEVFLKATLPIASWINGWKPASIRRWLTFLSLPVSSKPSALPGTTTNVTMKPLHGAPPISNIP